MATTTTLMVMMVPPDTVEEAKVKMDFGVIEETSMDNDNVLMTSIGQQTP